MTAPAHVPPSRPEHLVVVTHVRHYRHAGRLYAYAPYARELAAWAHLFPRLTVAAPCRDARPPADTAPLPAHVAVAPQVESGGQSAVAKLVQLARLPEMAWRLTRALAAADAVHVRCPGNLGLLGALLAPLITRRRVAKYAGQWGPFPGEARTVRWQRAVLRSRWWGAPVLAYGPAPDDPPHVVPAFSPALTEAQEARAAATARHPRGGARVVYVGRLTTAKRVDVLLRAVAALRATGVPVRCRVVGDGPARGALERLADTLGLGAAAEFTGALPQDAVFAVYRAADVVVLASDTEGWPKTLVEAMAFGAVCIGTDRGIVPHILGEGRGHVVPPGDPAALAASLRRVLADPAAVVMTRARAAAWARGHTFERFEAELGTLLSVWWDRAGTVPTGGRAPVRVAGASG